MHMIATLPVPGWLPKSRSGTTDRPIYHRDSQGRLMLVRHGQTVMFRSIISARSGGVLSFVWRTGDVEPLCMPLIAEMSLEVFRFAAPGSLGIFFCADSIKTRQIEALNPWLLRSERACLSMRLCPSTGPSPNSRAHPLSP